MQVSEHWQITVLQQASERYDHFYHPAFLNFNDLAGVAATSVKGSAYSPSVIIPSKSVESVASTLIGDDSY